MRLWAAELLHVDVLARHGAHHVGTGHEDAPGRRHDHHVGQRRAVGRAAGRRSDHHGDLRHSTRRPHDGGEHLAHRVERSDSLRQPGTAGVPDPHPRSVLAHCRFAYNDTVAVLLDVHAVRVMRAGGGMGAVQVRADLDLRRMQAQLPAHVVAHRDLGQLGGPDQVAGRGVRRAGA
jgi:hypothetical protein